MSTVDANPSLTKCSDSQVIQLDWSNEGGSVTVTPRDQDRFNMRMERAIEACKAAVQRERFVRQFNFLLTRIAIWLSRRTAVKDAYVTLQDGRILFLAVMKSTEYDRDFEDSLTELNFQIADDPELKEIGLDVMALPAVSEEALRSFYDPKMSYKLEGKSGQ